MKKHVIRHTKCLLLLLLSTIFMVFVPINIFAYNEPSPKDGFLVIDTDKQQPLPSRFRIIPSLNISGSAQFLPSQVENIKKSINKEDIYIVDLRQESHGFLNDIAVSYYSPDTLLNKGFTSTETLADEKSRFGAITPGTKVSLYNKRGKLQNTITVETSEIEPDVVKKHGLNYILFATRDGHTPTPEVVDEFVEFVKNTPKTTHLHFHCAHGEGRTTMFMALFQMMNNDSGKTLDEILEEQLKAGGIVLTNNATRAKFLQSFYDYTLQNSKDNYKIPYSKWISQQKS
ncbi:phosphatase [Clostridium sp.]|uniref:fused DSP-PTPase phosphatase/NAD kinase-like protein n=1 Tax=Clostridium sp. TaxID=1506 RepID=UPI003464B336